MRQIPGRTLEQTVLVFNFPFLCDDVARVRAPCGKRGDILRLQKVSANIYWMSVQRSVENSDEKDEGQTWRNSKLADTSTTSSTTWLTCSAVPEFCPKQGSIQKEEVKEDVKCRGQEVALDSGSSIFKARPDQLRVPKQFTQTLLASFSCINCSEDKLHLRTCHTHRAAGLNKNLFLPHIQTRHWEEVWLLSFILLKSKNINNFFP